ncbi:MAG: hormogonium polysaccharide biosynthesis glycosyltransferase HpsE [Cyanobacteria bacterium J06635_1]
MVDFSVAIRTYNGAKRLPKILAALKAQSLIGTSKQGDFEWEILVVDNNSTDNPQAIIQQFRLDWPKGSPKCSLRYVLEPKQGASFARRRALLEARGRWVGFLDDDNIPHVNWLAAAYRFGQAHPQAAAFGGQIHARYESPPPAHFDRIASFMPVIERDETICFTHGWRAMSNLVPPGAGLVVQRQVWLTHVPEVLILKGPVGNSLAQKGEDTEALLHLKKAGWEIWFNPKMRIYHQIARHRFEWDYLRRFFEGVGLSKYTTRMVACARWQRPIMTLLFLVSDIRKLLHHVITHGLCLDVVAACERQLIVSSLWSPFYTWKQWLCR